MKSLFGIRVLKGAAASYTLLAILGLVSVGLSTYQINVTQKLTDSMLMASSLHTPMIYLSIMLGILLLGRLVVHLKQYSQELVQQYVQFNLDQILVDAINPLTITNIETPDYHNDLNMMRYGHSSVASLYASFVQIMTAIISTVVYTIIIIQQIWFLPIIVLIINIPIMLHELSMADRRFVFVEQISEVARRRTLLQELILRPAALKEILIFSAKKYLQGIWSQSYIEELKQESSFRRFELIRKILLSLATIGGQVLMQFFLMAGVVNNSISIGTYVATLATVGMLESALITFATSAGYLKQCQLANRNFMLFLNKYESKSSNVDITQSELIENINLKLLSFTYPNQSAPALNEVTIHFQLGENIAIVGDNGSGKSTLAKAIAGLHDVGKKSIYYNGKDIHLLDRKKLFEQFSIVTQDFINYPLTIYENIVMSQIENRQRFYDIVEQYPYLLPRDIDFMTALGNEFQGSRQLSGGQWQKIAIARALFKSSPYLILDEATSALDPETEIRLLKDILSNRTRETTIAVTHRLHSCQLFDTIWVMQDGIIVETGSHNELMKQRGKYFSMFNVQQKEEMKSHNGLISTIV
jgi:ABC-type bacteriocin/lantibiotic exporter with double-glycine peptidase domain